MTWIKKWVTDHQQWLDFRKVPPTVAEDLIGFANKEMIEEILDLEVNLLQARLENKELKKK